MALRVASGQMSLGPDPGSRDQPDRDSRTVSARDFRYDRTGLPRYPTAVQGVASALTTRPQAPTDYRTTAVIVTASSFGDVVSWYQAQLPSGWTNQSTGDFARLANALSADSFKAMLSGKPAPAPAAPAAPRVALAMFSPPPGTPDERAIMIVQRDGKPVTVLMKAHHTG